MAINCVEICVNWGLYYIRCSGISCSVVRFLLKLEACFVRTVSVVSVVSLCNPANSVQCSHMFSAPIVVPPQPVSDPRRCSTLHRCVPSFLLKRLWKVIWSCNWNGKSVIIVQRTGAGIAFISILVQYIRIQGF